MKRLDDTLGCPFLNIPVLGSERGFRTEAEGSRLPSEIMSQVEKEGVVGDKRALEGTLLSNRPS